MNWIFWALMSALFAGLTAVWAKIGVTGVSSNLATAIRTTVVLIVAWAVVLVTKDTAALSTLSKRSWTFLLLSGVATALSWLCYFRALQLGEASKVAPLDKLSVIFVVIFAVLLLGESVNAKSIAGVVLIASGAELLSLK